MSRPVLALWFCLCLVIGVAFLMATAVATLAGPLQATPASEKQQKLKERDRYLAEASQLYEEGKLAEAIAAGQKMLAIERQVFGDVHADVAGSLDWLARIHMEREDFVAARQARQEVVTTRTKLYGARDWRVTDARLALEDVERLARMTVQQRRRLAEARQLNRQAVTLHRQGRSRQAVQLARQALEIRKEMLGEQHTDYANSLHNLAFLYKALGDYAQAEPLMRRAVQIKKQVLGQQHPEYATCLHNLAGLYEAQGDYAQAESLMRRSLGITQQTLGEQTPDYAIGLDDLATLYTFKGDYTKAEPLYRRALQIQRQTLGELHPEYATTLNNLAVLYKTLGAYARAEPLYRRALEISKQVQGEQHPDYATSLNNLALLYKEQGDYTQAEPLYRRALEITKQTLGEQHPDYASSLNNLAQLYKEKGDYLQAEPLLRRALEITKQTEGPGHRDYAQSLHNLAGLYEAQGDYARAEPLMLRALAITKQALGEQHPDYAVGLNYLAMLYKDMGAYSQAEPLLRRAVQINKQALGEQHPGYATSLHNLAALYQSEAAGLCRLVPQTNPWLDLAAVYGCHSDSARAERLLHQALDICRANLELAAAAQSQRQELAMLQDLRSYLDDYLSLAPQAQSDPTLQYRAVLAWKGAVGRRQRQQRLARQQPELAQDFADLDRISSRLAALALATGDPARLEERRQAIEKLTEQKERLEGQLSRRSSAFRAEKELQQLTPAQLQAALPADAALIDFLEYDYCSPSLEKKGSWHWEQRLVAFVVRSDALVRVDLGPSLPLREAVSRWRLALLRRFRTEADTELAGQVRRLLWQPLEPHLKGARLVLVSPDGDLGRVPFAALPGRTKDSYLVEELALAVVPVPQLLPELLASRAGEGKTQPSLLVVGDVRYDAAAGEAPADSEVAPSGPTGTLLRWKALEHTRAEVAAIKDSFQRRFRKASVTDLREDEATEAAVRKEAPGHRYLHLATHGFFAPKELRSALAKVSHGDRAPSANLFGREGVAGFHPGLLSGLVLAGANQPPEPGKDDGILTALEVETLDLCGVELAVLSACETGLGEEAGGEGLLGLQRAFQVAGAASVVAGLWQVDDKATQELMVRFYENLWKRKLSKLEALRQAQLWMLQEGVARGMTDVRVPKERLPKDEDRLAPFYWAAFALSGDWR